MPKQRKRNQENLALGNYRFRAIKKKSKADKPGV
jgi:hypothetical protein